MQRKERTKSMLQSAPSNANKYHYTPAAIVVKLEEGFCVSTFSITFQDTMDVRRHPATCGQN